MRSIEVYDTTLRDGTQGEGFSLSLQDKLLITQRLDEMGVDYVEGGYPLSNPKDAEYFQRVRELKLKTSRICAFGMTRRRGMKVDEDPGIKALIDSQAPVITIVGKTWDLHVTEVLHVALEENLAMISETIAYLVAVGRDVIYDAEHFFDGWSANAPYAARTIQAAAGAGAKTVVLCDTNGGTMPEQISRLTTEAQRALGDYRANLGIHCHNDCELAVANSLAAIQAGAVQVQGTINGVGERCGNANLISIVANIGLKMPELQALNGRSLEHLTELSRFVYEVANMHLRRDQPFVGQSAFAHKGGMHVHAVNKIAHSYEHIDPSLVGNERRVLVSELSGRSNVLALALQHDLQQELQGDRKLMDTILDRLVTLEHQGYQFEAATASFSLLCARCAGRFRPHFELLKYHVDVEHVGDSPQSCTVTEASVKLQVNGQTRHEVAEGDGPVNALDAALRKALNGFYPSLQKMRLIDYKVRVVNEEAGTAARIRVVIESTDGEEIWGTVGVSENIIEASWLALVDAVEYKLCRDESRTTTTAG